MANKIFENLLIEQINIFKESFTNISKDIFSDNSGKLIHPGEFGTYREVYWFCIGSMENGHRG